MDIQSLEAKYGKKRLRKARIKTEDGVYNFIYRLPSRSLILAVANAKNNEAKAADIMIKNCVIGGDIEALEYGEVFQKVMEDISGLFGKATSDVKKL